MTLLHNNPGDFVRASKLENSEIDTKPATDTVETCHKSQSEGGLEAGQCHGFGCMS